MAEFYVHTVMNRIRIDFELGLSRDKAVHRRCTEKQTKKSMKNETRFFGSFFFLRLDISFLVRKRYIYHLDKVDLVQRDAY